MVYDNFHPPVFGDFDSPFCTAAAPDMVDVGIAKVAFLQSPEYGGRFHGGVLRRRDSEHPAGPVVDVGYGKPDVSPIKAIGRAFFYRL